MRGSKLSLAGLALCGLLVIGAPVRASTFTEYLYDCGPNVCASGSGTINTTSLTNEGGASNPPYPPEINPSAGFLFSGSDNLWIEFGVITGPNSFGSGGYTPATSSSGSNVGIYAYPAAYSPAVFVPYNYTSGTFLTSSAVFDATTLVALGVTTGTYTWTWDGGSFTIEAGVTPTTPLPAALPLFAIGLGGLGFFGWRRKRKALAVAA